MHFGMAGWFHIRNFDTRLYKPNASKDSTEWPPKYWKFHLQTTEDPQVEAAFVDFRRFARIRLIDCDAAEIRKMSPLVENGPDPIVDKDIVTEEWLAAKLASKHVPVKALLLDQGNISGIGNWVGDEIMYDARIHPEQYSDTLSSAQVAQLHKSIQYVCGFAVENLSDHSKFPEHWLFNHRWGKGKKDSATTLPNGSKFVFLTVGGRTSCVVPSVQKKTGPVAGDVKGSGVQGGKGATRAKKDTNEEEVNKGEAEDVKVEPTTEKKPVKGSRKRKSEVVEDAPEEESERKPRKSTKKIETNGAEDDGKAKKAKSTGVKEKETTKSKAKSAVKEKVEANIGRRRSARVSGK